MKTRKKRGTSLQPLLAAPAVSVSSNSSSALSDDWAGRPDDESAVRCVENGVSFLRAITRE